MRAVRPDHDCNSGAAPAEGHVDVTELVLPVRRRQMAALEKAARRRGLTTGVLLRRLIADFLGRETQTGRRGD